MSRETERAPVPGDSDDLTSQAHIIVLTGPRLAGKTSACNDLARLAAGSGHSVAGILCPAVFSDGRKAGISVADLNSGESRQLASRVPEPRPGELHYRFEETALAWADDVVASISTCDLLIVDEIGPLEIHQARGLISAFEVLRRRQYRLAVVVVRPELVGAFVERLGLPCELLSREDFDARAALARLADPSKPVEGCSE